MMHTRVLQEGGNDTGIGSTLHVFGARCGCEGTTSLTLPEDEMHFLSSSVSMSRISIEVSSRS